MLCYLPLELCLDLRDTSTQLILEQESPFTSKALNSELF